MHTITMYSEHDMFQIKFDDKSFELYNQHLWKIDDNGKIYRHNQPFARKLLKINKRRKFKFIDGDKTNYCSANLEALPLKPRELALSLAKTCPSCSMTFERRTKNSTYCLTCRNTKSRLAQSRYYAKRKLTLSDDDYITLKLKQTQAKLEGKSFNINIHDIKSQMIKQANKCYYTGKPLVFITGQQNSFSIDRINSLIGYEIDNIVLCLKDVNFMKRHYNVEHFIMICNLIADTHPR